MKIVRLSKKDYRERFGDTDAHVSRYKGTEPTIYLPGGASTKEILHEIYHATKSPELEEIEAGKETHTLSEWVLEELRADQFASQSIGHRGILESQLASLIGVMIDEGIRPNTILRCMTEALEEEGYRVDDNFKSLIWWLIRDSYSAEKGAR